MSWNLGVVNRKSGGKIATEHRKRDPRGAPELGEALSGTSAWLQPPRRIESWMSGIRLTCCCIGTNTTNDTAPCLSDWCLGCLLT